MTRTLLSTTLLLLLAACAREDAPAADPATADAPAATTPATADAPPPAPDQPAQDVPPATAAPAGGSLHVGLPAEGTIGFGGFGPASFGASAEEVRMAWGGDLGEPQPPEPAGCYYLMPQPAPEGGYRVAFMIEGDKFARIDVRTDAVTAPGGGKVDMTRAEIDKLYAGRIEERPHKYTDGSYLRIADPDGGKGVLIFETDAKGDTAKVTEWRIGVPPQVDYIEGCS